MRCTIFMAALALGACVGPQTQEAKVAVPPSQPSIHGPMTKKTSAPVGVTLNSDRIAGTVTVELNAVASADCPDARYQFKVPPGVDVMEGPVSKRVGTLSKGRGLRARLVLRVPLGKPTLIAAGVTCQVAPNAALVKSAVLTLGTPPQPTAGVARKLQVKGTGMNLNIAPAVQLKSDKVDGTGR